MALILLRHTQVALPAGTCYGQLDVALSQPAQPSFDDVRQRLAALLEEISTATGSTASLVRIVTSPLRRAAELAAALAQTWPVPVEPDPRWMELHFGCWEGRLWDDVPRHEIDTWADDVDCRAPPGGETRSALAQRVQAALAAVWHAAQVPGQVVLVVAHAGPIRMALPQDRHDDPHALSPAMGCMSWLQPHAPAGGWTLRAFNR
jgi:alpha-ribazole phosphatase